MASLKKKLNSERRRKGDIVTHKNVLGKNDDQSHVINIDIMRVIGILIWER